MVEQQTADQERARLIEGALEAYKKLPDEVRAMIRGVGKRVNYLDTVAIVHSAEEVDPLREPMETLKRDMEREIRAATGKAMEGQDKPALDFLGKVDGLLMECQNPREGNKYDWELGRSAMGTLRDKIQVYENLTNPPEVTITTA